MEKVCEICGGSGQIGQFLGVSRFVITWEECPECCGTGNCQSPEEQGSQESKQSQVPANKSGKDKQTPDR